MFNCLELFSGNGDITRYLSSLDDVSCTSVDYDPSKNADHCADVYKLTDSFLSQFDFIWLSPDCTTYSIASHGLHRSKGGHPKTEYALFCDINNNHFIKRLISLNIPFIMENPRGHMRTRDFTKGLYRRTVYYSTYGLPYEKPTDLYTNYPYLLEFFDLKCVRSHIQCSNQHSFLARCKMPHRLIENIGECVLFLKHCNEVNYE